MGLFVTERYELLRSIGRGPISELHLARLCASAGFARPVAVRSLNERLAKDPRFVGTWAAAASEIAQRPSPHLEDVLDLVVDGERVYLVTEWIEGLSLARFLASFEAPPPWPLVTRVLVGLLDGLHRLHTIEPPLVHRGVGAAAVRISVDGAVKLTRSGVAAGLAAIGEGRADAERSGLWRPSPEVLEGGAAVPASDIFGAGGLAFEALAGTPAFGEDLRAEPADLASLRADVPPLLVALIERALRAEPEDRFASADEMARALERLLHAEPKPVDAPALGQAVREARERLDRPASSAGAPVGPAALAASVRGMKKSEPKRPRGLPTQHTIHVDETELVVLSDLGTLPPPAGPPDEADPAPEGLPPEVESPEPKRYKFEPKERAATKRAMGLVPQESEAIPLMLTKSRTSSVPLGLRPANTEFLDEDQVDRLTLDPAKRPQGLGRARTEFLDEDQVDRLTMPESPRSKRPSGLQPSKTEFLDEDEVDQLRVDD